MGDINYRDINIMFNNEFLYEDFKVNIYIGKINIFMGKSGIGKTTLVEYIKESMLKSGEKVSYVFQEDRLIYWKSVYNNLKLIVDDVNKINKVLEIVDLLDYKDYYPRELSGGMKQRVNIARALIYESNCIILDEPFKGIDLESKKRLIIEIKKYISKNNKTAILVSHDVEDVISLGGVLNILGNKPVEIIKSYKLNGITKEDIIRDLYV